MKDESILSLVELIPARFGVVYHIFARQAEYLYIRLSEAELSFKLYFGNCINFGVDAGVVEKLGEVFDVLDLAWLSYSISFAGKSAKSIKFHYFLCFLENPDK